MVKPPVKPGAFGPGDLSGGAPLGPSLEGCGAGQAHHFLSGPSLFCFCFWRCFWCSQNKAILPAISPHTKRNRRHELPHMSYVIGILSGLQRFFSAFSEFSVHGFHAHEITELPSRSTPTFYRFNIFQLGSPECTVTWIYL